MIRHVALFRFNTGQYQDSIEELLCDFKRLENNIPGLVSVYAGANKTGEPFTQGFHHGIIMDFSTEVDLQNYLTHELHVPLADRVGALLLEGFECDVIVFDLQI